MSAFQDRRVVLAVAGGAALLLAVLATAFVLGARRERPAPADPARTGLQVTMGATGGGRLDPKAPLRCFVDGRFVGEASLAECARRNGVTAGRMDVGVDASGAVAAAGEGQAGLAAPLPEAPAEAPVRAEAAPSPAPVGKECLRYAGGGWRPAGAGLSLRGCVRALYEGRCVRAGDALYGRYGTQTLRLVPGRVEVSPDNRDFSTLATADAEACTLDG